MSWEVILAVSVTLPSLLIAAFLVAAIFLRRYRVYHYHKQRYLAGPRHVNHPRCRCHICQIEAQQRSRY
jgi:hypothetical protein